MGAKFATAQQRPLATRRESSLSRRRLCCTLSEYGFSMSRDSREQKEKPAKNDAASSGRGKAVKAARPDSCDPSFLFTYIGAENSQVS